MKLKETDDAVVIEPAAAATGAVIWLHGLGASGHDFVPIVPELGVDDLALRFVFPHAPMRPVTVNLGMSMRAWYDIFSARNMQKQDEAGIRASEHLVHGFLQREQDLGIPAERIVLAGFSQGGAIALHTGLRYPQRLAGLLALSTYLPLGDQFVREANPARKDTPILMCHGDSDPMLPLVMGHWSRDLLLERGYKLEWREYPMQHQVCPEEIEDIGRWLRQRLV